MKLAEAWRLSQLPYREEVYQSLAEEKGRMWWGAFGRHQSGMENQNDFELATRVLRIAKFDKILVSVFNVMVAALPFVMLLFGTQVFGLADSVALSLAVTLGFTALYAIQTLSSFVSADSSVLLLILPLARNDFSLISIFSFIRSVDYMVVGSVASQVVLVALVTHSPLAALIMLVTAVMNQVFAVTIALWFSTVFQRNLMRGRRSKVDTFLRLIFILMWGLLLVGVGFMFVVPLYTMPGQGSLLLGFGNVSSVLFALLYPFSTGNLIAGITFSNVATLTMLVSSLTLTGYAVLTLVAGKWTFETVKRISLGAGKKNIRVAAKDFSVKIHSPLFGYVLKDLKVASKNPATALFFALPALETVMTILLVSNLSTLRTVFLLDATLMGAIFALLIPLALLTAEGRGFEYSKTLPISSRRIVVSKTLVSTATYILVPIALIGLSIVKPLTSPSIILIPLLTTLSVASASIFEIILFLRSAAKNKINAIVNDLEKLIVGGLVILFPLVMYSIVFLLSFNHILSILVMGLVALSELTGAMYLLRRS